MKDDKFLMVTVVLIVLSNLLSDVFLWITRDMTTAVLGDLIGQRTLCAYTLHGVDPYPQIGVEPPLLSNVGVIPKDFGTSPWGLILGNFFYPGFLPIELAKIYFLALNIILLLTTAFIVYDASKKISERLGVISLALFALPASFMLSMWYGNAGGGVVCLLMLCCVECERRPILTGVLLSIAMIKPQVALTFCILFLLQRRFKVLLTAAAIDLCACFLAAALTDTTPFTLLSEMMNANIGGGKMFSGIFRIFFLTEPTNSMCLSMIVGVLFIVYLHRRTTEREFLSMYPACVAALFWSYSTSSEYFMLTLPALVCFRIMFETDVGRLKFLAMGIFFYSALLFLKIFDLSCDLFSFNQMLGMSHQSCKIIGLVLRVVFCFVFIEMALCINRAQRALNRVAD